MYLLKNEQLSIEISPKGAELQSVKDNSGREWLWQGDPAVWGGKAPLLFPIIGRLREGSYTFEGKSYQIPNHGFARHSQFQCLSHTDTQLCLSLSDSEETRKVYPFAVELQVTFRLEGTSLVKEHKVINRQDTPLYYEVGGHDAYNLGFYPGESMDDCHFTFPASVTEVHPYDMTEEVFLKENKLTLPVGDAGLGIKPVQFGLDSLVLDDLETREVSLADSKGNTRVTVRFSDFPVLALWTTASVENSMYACMEPWSALPDGLFFGRDLLDKPGIRKVTQEDTTSFTTTFFLNPEL